MSQTFWTTDLDLPGSQAFVQAFVQMFGHPPGFWGAATAYAALQVLQQAIEAVNSFDQTAIGQYIITHSFQTILGTYNYNNGKNGMPDTLIFMVQWQSKKLVTVTDPSKVVYPKPPFPS